MRSAIAFTFLALGCAPGARHVASEVGVTCDARVASADACSEACFDADLAAYEGACESVNARVNASSELSPFLDCIDLCPTVRTCEVRFTSFSLTECSCVVACLAERSAEFVDAYAEQELCLARATDGVCQGRR